MADIDWTVLARYAAADCTTEERLQVETWLAAAPENAAQLAAIREVAALNGRANSAKERAETLAQVRRKVAVATTDIGRSRMRVHGRAHARAPWRHAPPMLRIAAIIVVAVGLSVLGYTRWRRPSASIDVAATSFRTFTTPRAGRLSLRLPDGTLAELAPASTLRLPEDYGKRDRKIELIGEAVFTATHDTSRPLTVYTARLVARDLGTRFIVREYSGEAAALVVVAEGAVAVTRDASVGRQVSGSIVLRTGEGVRTADDGRLVPIQDLSLDTYFGWTQGRLVFRGTPLQEAAAELERWYDIDVRLASPELAALPLSATFEYTDVASAVVQMIADGFDLKLVRDGRVYTLQTK